MFDKIIFVCADDTTRLLRILKRDALTKEQAKARMDSQIAQDEKKARANNCIIENNGTLKELEEKVKATLELLE